jgi:hypothetical protein
MRRKRKRRKALTAQTVKDIMCLKSLRRPLTIANFARNSKHIPKEEKDE